jgi:plastocyanin
MARRLGRNREAVGHSDHVLEDAMRKTLIAAIAATMLLGCGKDSTGPGDNVNPNPDPKHYTITVNGGVFDPDTQTALIGDVIYWEVDAEDDGEHQINFTNAPDDVAPSPTKRLTAGQRDSTIFLKQGTYEYEDLVDQGGGLRGTGVVIINPLP